MSQMQIALFGEAEKGKYHIPHACSNVAELYDYFGNPPEEGSGMKFAIQALLYEQKVLFFRVKEEGYSKNDYFKGLKHLQDPEKTGFIQALFLPGVGDEEILSHANLILMVHKSILIIQEKDLYDYLTSSF